MQQHLFAASLLILSFTYLAFGQTPVSKHRIRGIIRDQTAAVVPLLGLTASKNGELSYGSTDMNGEFLIELSPGDQIVTVPELKEGAFKAFIKIVEGGPNPEFVEFVIDPTTLCKQLPEKYNYPSIIKSFAPKFPPAAKAVRASGTVLVMTRTGIDGKVISATAVSGHPLLRAVSLGAARQFEFDPLEIKNEAELPLRFIFVHSYPTKDILRYNCPYRIVINSEPSVIDISEH